MLRYREVNKKDWIDSIFVILVFVSIITITSLLFLPDNWILWITIVLVGTLYLVKLHSEKYAYECSNCHHQFEISAAIELITPNGLGKKLIKCPKCLKRSWMKILIITK